MEEGEYAVNLMDSFASDCITLAKTITKDEYGGYITTWVEGATFSASFEYSASPEVIVAEKQGVARVYKVYIDRRLNFEYHDVFRRISDGQVFRVTNGGADRATPNSSTLDKRLVEVEKWVLPNA